MLDFELSISRFGNIVPDSVIMLFSEFRRVCEAYWSRPTFEIQEIFGSIANRLLINI